MNLLHNCWEVFIDSELWACNFNFVSKLKNILYYKNQPTIIPSGQSSPSNTSSNSSQAEFRHPPGLETGKQYCEDPPLVTVCRQSSCPRTFKYAGGSPPIVKGQNTHSRPENLKQSRPKKLVKSNKSISRIRIEFYLTKFHFLQFQKWPKINF